MDVTWASYDSQQDQSIIVLLYNKHTQWHNNNPDNAKSPKELFLSQGDTDDENKTTSIYSLLMHAMLCVLILPKAVR